MNTCHASFLLERDEDHPWPAGEWSPCANESTHVAWLNVSEGCVVFLELCDAHAALWAEALGGPEVQLELPK